MSIRSTSAARRPHTALLFAFCLTLGPGSAQSGANLAPSTAPNADAVAWLDEATDEAVKIESDTDRQAHYRNLAVAYASLGDLDTALRLTRSIGYKDSVRVARRNIAVALAAAGDFERAGKTLAPINDPGHRRWGHTRIAEIHAARGNKDLARRAFDDAIADALTIEPERLREWNILWIAEAQRASGDPDASLQTLQRIPSPDFKLAAYHDIAREQARKGDLAALKLTLELLKPEPEKYLLDEHLTIASANAGDFDNALGSVEKIGDSLSRSRARIAIAVALARAGRTADADRLFAENLRVFSAENPAVASHHRAATAEAQITVGRPDAATQNILALTDEFQRDFRWKLLSTAYARSGDVENAERAAERISSRYQIGNALGAVAIALAQTRQIEPAKRIALKAGSGQASGDACRAIAHAIAASGDLPAALAWSRQLPTPCHRSYALLGVFDSRYPPPNLDGR
jgi:tetratricopeptide (TPR) repeat protein